MKFHLFYKLFFLLTVLKACESSISYNDDNLNIDRDKSSNDLILKEDINSLGSSLYSFIALGDSYTVGEGVNEYERWPNQFVDVAYENGVDFDQEIKLKKGLMENSKDNKKYKLEKGMCVITDKSSILGLGGIIGGTKTSTEFETKNILLESAYFAPSSIRRTCSSTLSTPSTSLR
mgnify:CR=1 FL=1